MTTSYFLSRDVVPTIGGGMAQWREKLFAQMHHNASGAADFLNLPNNAVVELGSKIEISWVRKPTLTPGDATRPPCPVGHCMSSLAFLGPPSRAC
jgi:hypothetical protein